MDSERVQICMAASRRLRKLVLPILRRSTVLSGLVVTASPISLSFLKGYLPDIIFCKQPSCGAMESDRYLFFECDHKAQLWGELLPLNVSANLTKAEYLHDYAP
ncbi:hypothetical protein ABG067_002711 [Albugo candida]